MSSEPEPHPGLALIPDPPAGSMRSLRDDRDAQVHPHGPFRIPGRSIRRRWSTTARPDGESCT